MIEQRSPSFNVYNQRNFSPSTRHQTLTKSRLEKNAVSKNKKKEPTVLLPKYSQDFMLRQQHIEELRQRRSQQLDTDPLAHRHSGQNLHVPTADTSRLHMSRRTFGLQVNQIRPRIDTTTPISFLSSTRRPLSASRRRVVKSDKERCVSERRRAKSADAIRRSHSMYGMDHCAAHEIALDDVTEEFEMVVRSPKPWIPSDAASKKSATRVTSSNSQHRAVKESLEYGMRHKAWKRGPWPSLASVDDSESRSIYNNGATSGSASVTSNSFRTRPYSVELRKALSPKLSHCAGDIRHLEMQESGYVASYNDDYVHSPTLYTTSSHSHRSYNSMKANLSPQDVLLPPNLSGNRGTVDATGLRINQNMINNNTMDSSRGVSPITEDLTEAYISGSRKSSTDSTVFARMGQYLGVSTKVIDVMDSNNLEFGFVVLRRNMSCIDIVETTLKHLNMKSQLPQEGIIARSVAEGIVTTDQRYVISDMILCSKANPQRISLFEVNTREMFDLDDSNELTLIRASVHSMVASAQSSPTDEREISRRQASSHLSSSPAISYQQVSQQQQRLHNQSMDTGMSSPMDSLDVSQQQQRHEYTPPPVNPSQQKEKTGSFLGMFNKLTSSSRSSQQPSYSPDKPSVPSGISRTHSLPSSKPTALMEPEEDSMTTATNTTLQSSRSVPTQKEGSYTNRSVNYSREVIGGRKINAMSEYEVNLNEL